MRDTVRLQLTHFRDRPRQTQSQPVSNTQRNSPTCLRASRESPATHSRRADVAADSDFVEGEIAQDTHECVGPHREIFASRDSVSTILKNQTCLSAAVAPPTIRFAFQYLLLGTTVRFMYPIRTLDSSNVLERGLRRLSRTLSIVPSPRHQPRPLSKRLAFNSNLSETPPSCRRQSVSARDGSPRRAPARRAHRTGPAASPFGSPTCTTK